MAFFGMSWDFAWTFARGFFMFRLPDGSKMEVFGPEPNGPALRHGSGCGILGFQCVRSHRRLRSGGAEILLEPETDSSDNAWVHVRAPDGNTYELIQDLGVSDPTDDHCDRPCSGGQRHEAITSRARLSAGCIVMARSFREVRSHEQCRMSSMAMRPRGCASERASHPCTVGRASRTTHSDVVTRNY